MFWYFFVCPDGAPRLSRSESGCPIRGVGKLLPHGEPHVTERLATRLGLFGHLVDHLLVVDDHLGDGGVAGSAQAAVRTLGVHGLAEAVAIQDHLDRIHRRLPLDDDVEGRVDPSVRELLCRDAPEEHDRLVRRLSLAATATTATTVGVDLGVFLGPSTGEIRTLPLGTCLGLRGTTLQLLDVRGLVGAVRAGVNGQNCLPLVRGHSNSGFLYPSTL